MSSLDLGAIEMALKRPSEAEEIYKKLAIHPSRKYQTAHAIFQFQQGKQSEGIAELEKLHSANASDRKIRNQLVGAYLAVNRGPMPRRS